MNEFKIVHTDNTEKSRRVLIEALNEGFTILHSVFVGNMRVQYVLGNYAPKVYEPEETLPEEEPTNEE